MNDVISQKAVCVQYGSEFIPPAPHEKVGIALNTLGQLRLNALRHPAENGTCGWYIWGGEVLSQEPDFFNRFMCSIFQSVAPKSFRFLLLRLGGVFSWPPVKLTFGSKRGFSMCSMPNPAVKRDCQVTP